MKFIAWALMIVLCSSPTLLVSQGTPYIPAPAPVPNPMDPTFRLQQLEIQRQQLGAKIQALEIQPRNVSGFPINQYLNLKSQVRDIELQQMQMMQNQKLDLQFQRQFEEQQRMNRELQEKMNR